MHKSEEKQNNKTCPLPNETKRNKTCPRPDETKGRELVRAQTKKRNERVHRNETREKKNRRQIIKNPSFRTQVRLIKSKNDPSHTVRNFRTPNTWTAITHLLNQPQLQRPAGPRGLHYKY